MSSSPIPPRGYHHGALKESLVSLALEHLAAGERPEDLSIRTLAQQLKVSQGAPYRHFPTFEALIAAVAEQGFRRMSAKMGQVREGLDSGSQELEALGVVYVEFALENPQLFRAMFTIPGASLGAYPELFLASGQAFTLLESAVSRFQKEKGEPRLPRSLAANAAWALVHGLAELAINNLTPHPQDSTQLRLLCQALTRGL